MQTQQSRKRGRTTYHLPGLTAVAIIMIALQILGDQTFTNSKPEPIDAKATPETKALYQNLKNLKGIMFGHQDDLAYGTHWKDVKDKSDVKDVAGSYPAIFGWDVSHLGESKNIDGVDFDSMRTWIQQGYTGGGVITISWHMRNPVTGKNPWDTTRAVNKILPGGTLHGFYKKRLDRFAQFIESLKDPGDGKTLIPIIFRPFHELNGSWFWWGKGHASPQEIKELYGFTVHYLRDVKQVHNLLYAFNTDVFNTKEEYLERYPGDDYVDVIGYDDYHSVKSADTRDIFVNRMHMLVDLAQSRGKVAALTEIGNAGIPEANWWTQTLLPALDHDATTRKIAWLLVWRNAYHQPKGAFAPYPGQVSTQDFKKFAESPLILLEDELPDMYRAHSSY